MCNFPETSSLQVLNHVVLAHENSCGHSRGVWEIAPFRGKDVLKNDIEYRGTRVRGDSETF